MTLHLEGEWHLSMSANTYFFLKFQTIISPGLMIDAATCPQPPESHHSQPYLYCHQPSTESDLFFRLNDYLLHMLVEVYLRTYKSSRDIPAILTLPFIPHSPCSTFQSHICVGYLIQLCYCFVLQPRLLEIMRENPWPNPIYPWPLLSPPLSSLPAFLHMNMASGPWKFFLCSPKYTILSLTFAFSTSTSAAGPLEK